MRLSSAWPWTAGRDLQVLAGLEQPTAVAQQIGAGQVQILPRSHGTATVVDGLRLGLQRASSGQGALVAVVEQAVHAYGQCAAAIAVHGAAAIVERAHADARIACGQDATAAIFQCLVDRQGAAAAAGGLDRALVVEQVRAAQIQRAIAGKRATSIVQAVACVHIQYIGARSDDRTTRIQQRARPHGDARSGQRSIAQIGGFARQLHGAPAARCRRHCRTVRW
ncbi:hypothetical protein G6F50_014477 [Rhizopus delemar]|uniref:Uncharacterized protein n=1 Tax=Rhizopus delemar TaxID=936053 RepID=A0A9P6Y550_9FUNG|nr:hypothetical protein G6F50_014477 [Rhizopus delemar]